MESIYYQRLSVPFPEVVVRLFDVHTHVQFAAFRGDAAAVIHRALENDVWMINVGTQKETSQAAIELAEKYLEGIWATVGLHPIHTEKSYHDSQELGGRGGFEGREEKFDYEYYKKLAKNPKIVAIGECGLDYYRLGEETRKRQKEVFEKQIGLAAEIKKPLMIHCRQAFADLIKIVSGAKVSGVVHFFSGTKEDAKELVELGFSFSFGGVITFARDYDQVVKYIPLDRILLESDAPYVAPVPHRGKRNEPGYVIEVAKKISEIKNISLEEVAEGTFQNAEKIFLKT